MTGAEGGGISAEKASNINSSRISAVVDRLGVHVSNDLEFFNLCISLSRGIDYAVANNEVPSKAQDLPTLLKRVCQCKTKLLQAGIMVLMISVKSACKTGWFSNDVSSKLLALADEVASSFSDIRDLNTDLGDCLQNIPTIIARFYPQFKMGQTLTVLKVKPGYGTYVRDFCISKSVKPSEEEKIRLFVAQIDDLQTSSCIISPPQANFLINGKCIERRTSVSMVGGPLVPTNVMHMLKYGTNMLQVLGHFSGNYVIVVAYMSMISSLNTAALQDYVQPEVSLHDQDSELVEGPSRISLNCPISCQRIKTPVKGHSCKHVQCFDFDNFVGINSQRPWWRCPCCNQCASYVDLRIDRYMAKVLKEVQKDVSEVIISADKSWMPFIKGQENMLSKQNPSYFSDAPLDLMDLTEVDDDINSLSSPIEIQDIKPIPADILNNFEVENTTVSSGVNNPNFVSQTNDGHIYTDFLSQILMSTYSSEVPGPRSQPQNIGDSTNSVLSNLQSQQSQVENFTVRNEYGEISAITLPRVQATLQSLQIQSPPFITQHSLSGNDNSNMNYGMPERQMQNCRPCLNIFQSSQTNSSSINPVNRSPMSLSSLPQFQTQVQHPQVYTFVPNPPTLSSTPSLRPSLRVPTWHQNSDPYPIRSPQVRTPLVMGHSPNPNLNRFSTQRPQNHNPVSHQQMSSAQRPNYAVTGGPVLIQANRDMSPALIGTSSPYVRPANGSHTDESGWRPTGRMRGALQGQAYHQAHQQFIFQPAQPIQATRPSTQPLSAISAALPNPKYC